MKPRLFTLCLCFLVCTPSVVHASKAIQWSFANANEVALWQKTDALRITKKRDSLELSASETSKFWRPIDAEFPIESVTFSVQTDANILVGFFWHTRGTSPEARLQMPVKILKSDYFQVVRFDVANFPQWDTHADFIGLELPAGAVLQLQNMEMQQANFFEEQLSKIQSFWFFDSFQAYSVNFLYGPLLASTPVGVQALWSNPPPVAPSANTFLYLLIAICIAVIFYNTKKSFSAKYIRSAVVCVCLLWIVYDTRMGMEYISGIWQDRAAIVAKEDFRDRKDFYVFLEEAQKHIQSDYVFLSAYQYPFRSILRYTTYPHVPTKDLDTPLWVVFEQPGISLNRDGKMQADTIVADGEVLYKLSNNAFIYKVL